MVNFFLKRMAVLLDSAVLVIFLFACSDSGTGGGDIELSSSSIEADDSSSSSGIKSSGSSVTESKDSLSRSQEKSSSSAAASSSSTTPKSSSSSAEVSGSSEAPEISSSSQVLQECTGMIWNPNTKFCYEGLVYSKCDGMEYNPSVQICIDDVALPKCGDTGYIPAKEFCDSRDNKVYKWVTIGTQTWMAENLNYATASGSWCYDDNPSNCETYGRLYGWEAAMTACPMGWHLPNNEEGNVLGDIAGAQLKSKTGWNGADDYGFNALPGGNRDSFGRSSWYEDVGRCGFWWSATEYNSDYAHYWLLIDLFTNGLHQGHKTEKAYAVRCVKD
ncbi:MAG: fibrobacter succinogenes major paralogous domain-containing protein [Fibrobacter sp.]|jgi:uncharacterized protein (TIGR02145 family)|nr:fibrobacter succinogenes major paralogous domain-containing protein [Fibrobacter sp.]